MSGGYLVKDKAKHSPRRKGKVSKTQWSFRVPAVVRHSEAQIPKVESVYWRMAYESYWCTINYQLNWEFK